MAEIVITCPECGLQAKVLPAEEQVVNERRDGQTHKSRHGYAGYHSWRGPASTRWMEVDQLPGNERG